MTGNRARSMEGRSTKQRLTIVLMLSASYLTAELIGGVAHE